MAEKEKGPRDLSRRPASKAAKDGPKHVRTDHGYRTTVSPTRAVDHETGVTEAEEEARKEAESEDFSRQEGRNTGAGPNPYKLKSVMESLKKDLDALVKDNPGFTKEQLATYLESSRESNASDAEIRAPGETLTETGQKIVLKPDRIAADEKAVLPNVKKRHSISDEGTDYEQARAAAYAEATAKSDDDLRADANPGFNVPQQAKDDLREATK